MTGTAHAHDAQDQQAMLIVRYICYSCVTFIVWEWLASIPFELQTIWRRTTPFLTRILYSIPRYLGLVSSVCNCVAILRIHTIYIVDQDTCQWWFGFQLLVTNTMILALEVLLMYRIFALFERNHKMATFLCTVLALKTVAVGTLAGFTISLAGFGDACLARYVPMTLVYSSVLEMLVQTIIWILTLYKHLRTHLIHGWFSIPLLSLITRDGSWSFLLVSVLYMALGKDAFTGIGHLSEWTARMSSVSFPILTATISFTSCRIIMNMHHFARRAPNPDEANTTQEIDFTTLSSTRPYSSG